MWVDWNPTPADKNMGLWGDVYLTDSGPLALRNPHVITDLDLPSLEPRGSPSPPRSGTPPTARRRASCAAPSRASSSRSAWRWGRASGRLVRFTPADAPGLDDREAAPLVAVPLGAQELYTLALDVDAEGAISDAQEVRFGIQQMTSELTPRGPPPVQGQRQADPHPRRRLGLRHAAAARITTERAGGRAALRARDGPQHHPPRGQARDATSSTTWPTSTGILLMPGWCCCDQWEQWDKWDAEDHRVGARVAARPDPAHAQPPERPRLVQRQRLPAAREGGAGVPRRAEEAGVAQARALERDRRARARSSGPSRREDAGPVRLRAAVLLADRHEERRRLRLRHRDRPGRRRAADREPGDRCCRADHLWPIDEVWRFHAGGDEFKDLKLFTDALEARYGKATGVEDYARKAQALAYEGQRAMFEAFARNKYRSTGVIQWMLNNAWPSMIWHLYDYYLRPGGGYFGTKKACEPLHVQYSYDDRSVVVVNDLQQAVTGLKVTAEVFDLDLGAKFAQEATVDVRRRRRGARASRAEDDRPRQDLLPAPHARGRGGQLVSRNFYWLSAQART